MRAFAVHLLVVASAALVARGADASTLYALHTVAGAPPESYWRVSEADSFGNPTQLIANLPYRPYWGDIAARPDDPDHLYAVSRLVGAPKNAISSIDLETGTVTDLFVFDSPDLGYPRPPNILEVTGLAFGASQPSVATVAATISDPSEDAYFPILFDLDLATGVPSNVQALSSIQLFGLGQLLDLAYAPDGRLFTNATYGGVPPSYWISTIDRSDGSVDPDPAHSCCSAPFAIEFDPSSGRFYAILGVEGLAVVVPEPGTGALLLLGLVGYGLASNGRGSSRHTSRRA